MPEDKPNLGTLAKILASPERPQLGIPLNFFEQYTVSDRVYRDQEINLDGYTFVNCAFINCALRTSKGNFHLEKCFIHLCTLMPSGDSLRILKIYAIFLGTWTELPEGLRPQVDSDGSVTIT